METTMLIKKIDENNSIIIDIETSESLSESMPHAAALAKFARIKTLTHLMNATFK